MRGREVKIICGGQSGVDRAALDAAIECGFPYGGWCPQGGWAEDYLDPPGVLADYPGLRETPLAEPAQRTEWNVRDADVTMIVIEAGGFAVSQGTALARRLAEKYRKPLVTIDLDALHAIERAAAWLGQQRLIRRRRQDTKDPGRENASPFTLGIGGPRESEVPGIYARSKMFLRALFVRF